MWCQLWDPQPSNAERFQCQTLLPAFRFRGPGRPFSSIHSRPTMYTTCVVPQACKAVRSFVGRRSPHFYPQSSRCEQSREARSTERAAAGEARVTLRCAAGWRRRGGSVVLSEITFFFFLAMKTFYHPGAPPPPGGPRRPSRLPRACGRGAAAAMASATGCAAGGILRRRGSRWGRAPSRGAGSAAFR